MHKKPLCVLAIFCCLSFTGIAIGQQSTTVVTAGNSQRTIADVKAVYQRSINVLAAGIKNDWTQEEFQSVIAKKHLSACEKSIQTLLQPPAIWDEKFHLPFQVEAKHTLESCRQERDQALSSMGASASLK